MVRVIVTAVAAVSVMTVMTVMIDGLPMAAVLAVRLLAKIMTGVLIEWVVSAHGRSFPSCSW